MSDSESLIVSSAGPRRIRIVVVVLSILFLFLVGVLALSFAVHAGERRFGYQSYTRSAVASDNVVCSQHGQELLDEGGNAVDAAIGVLLCLGVTHPHSSGLGGGAIFLIRTPTGLFDTVDARETAGAAAHVHMFKNTSSEKGGLVFSFFFFFFVFFFNGVVSLFCLEGLSVAVPGELSGMLEVHRRHGRLAWNRLFEQSVALCEQGFAVDSRCGKSKVF
jgi:gamma-glutamyltranspeptidase